MRKESSGCHRYYYLGSYRRHYNIIATNGVATFSLKCFSFLNSVYVVVEKNLLSVLDNLEVKLCSTIHNQCYFRTNIVRPRNRFQIIPTKEHHHIQQQCSQQEQTTKLQYIKENFKSSAESSSEFLGLEDEV